MTIPLGPLPQPYLFLIFAIWFGCTLPGAGLRHGFRNGVSRDKGQQLTHRSVARHSTSAPSARAASSSPSSPTLRPRQTCGPWVSFWSTWRVAAIPGGKLAQTTTLSARTSTTLVCLRRSCPCHLQAAPSLPASLRATLPTESAWLSCAQWSWPPRLSRPTAVTSRHTPTCRHLRLAPNLALT